MVFIFDIAAMLMAGVTEDMISGDNWSSNFSSYKAPKWRRWGGSQLWIWEENISVLKSESQLRGTCDDYYEIWNVYRSYTSRGIVSISDPMVLTWDEHEL